MNVRRIVLGLLYALTEASLVAPILAALPNPLQSLSHPAILGLTWAALVAIMAVYRVLATRDVSPAIQRIVLALWLAGLTGAFILFRIAQQGIQALGPLTVIAQFTAATLVWWRGRALGEVELTPAEAQQRLRTGLVLFSFYVIVTLLVPTYDWLTFLLPFLCSALLALPLSYLERVEQTDVGRHVPMTRRWWRWLLFSSGLAVLVALGVMAVFTPDILNEALTLFVSAVALPLAYLLGFLLDILFRLAGSLLNHPTSEPVAMPNLNALRPPLAEQTTTAASPLVISNGVIFGVVLAALFAMMAVMVLTTARARRQPIIVRRENDDEEIDATSDRDETPPAPQSLAGALGLRQRLAGVTIRRVYARMLREAGKRSFPRLPAQTPYDYIPQLAAAFPDADADVRLITDAYVAAHYGQAPDTDEELALIRAAWERVRAIPRRPTDKATEGAQ